MKYLASEKLPDSQAIGVCQPSQKKTADKKPADSHTIPLVCPRQSDKSLSLFRDINQ